MDFWIFFDNVQVVTGKFKLRKIEKYTLLMVFARMVKGWQKVRSFLKTSRANMKSEDLKI